MRNKKEPGIVSAIAYLLLGIFFLYLGIRSLFEDFDRGVTAIMLLIALLMISAGVYGISECIKRK